MAETDYRLQLILEAQDDMSEKIKAVKKQIEDMEKSVDDANKKVKEAGSSSVSVLNSIKGAIAKIGITAAITKVTASVVELADNLEQAKIAFTTMLGSAEDAEIMLNQLTEFAKKTPFELTGIRESAKQLLAMGVQASDMIPTLKALGDTSAGLSVPLERLAYNYGQVVSQGKLTGRELRDFTTAGVPLLDELSQMVGVSTTQIQDMVSKGQISSDMMVQAFRNMTDEGGRFADLMEKQATTLSGLWSNFQDTLASIGEEIGAELIPMLKDYVDQIGERTSENKDNIIAVCKEIFDTVKTVANNIVEALQEIRQANSELVDTLKEIFYDLFGSLLSTNDETVTGITQDRTDFFYFLKLGLTSAVQIVKTTLVAITSYFTALVKTIKTVVTNIGGLFGALRDDVKNGALNMASSCVNAVVKLVNGIIDKINWLADGIKELTGLDLTIGKVGEVDFGGADTGALGDKLSAMGDEIAGYFSDATSHTVDVFNSGMDAVIDVYANRVAEVTNRGAQIIKQSGGEIKKKYKETFGGMDEDGKGGKDKSAEKYKKEIKSMDDFMHNHLDKQKKLINDLNNEYQKKFDEIGNKIKDTEKNIEGLNDKIADLKKQMSDLKIDENKSLAKEVVNAKKELKSLEEQYEGLKEVANSVSREDLQNVGGVGKFDKDLINKYKDYQDELNSVYSGMSEQEKAALDQEIAYAEWYDSLNGIEKIKEDYRVRQEEIQNELNSKLIALQQEQDTLRMYKKEQDKLQTEWIKRIDEERQKYEGMYNALKQYEEQYMEQIEEDHNKQIEMTEKLIDHWNEVYRAKMRAMSAGSDGSRASGGPVYQGNQYLVGEKGPELFVPNTNGKIVKTSDLENSGNQNITLNVNLGSVSVSNESDQENLINTISQGILRKLELYRKGIRV